MKYVFIMNPSSGKKEKREKFLEQLKETAEALQIDYEIYFTKASKDGERYVRKICGEYAGRRKSLRIYGMGGDGTVNEMVNGAAGFDNVEVGIIPMGTGNDYVRNYGQVSDFLDIKSQIRGKARFSDLIQYRGEYKGKITAGYCANMFNIGFDCNVVDMTDRVKQWPLMSGSLAYMLSVFIILIKKKGADLRIEYEDGTVLDGKMLLTAIGKGAYCGGGIKAIPYCRQDDGFMDVSVIKNVTRSFFITLFSDYVKGKHYENKRVIERKIALYRKEKTLTVTANGESLRLCTDGEITTQKRIEFSVVKDAFRFIVPAHLCQG